MRDRINKTEFCQNNWRFAACIPTFLGMAGCGGPSQESTVPSSGESFPLTPTDLEYRSGTPAGFSNCLGHFALPIDLEARGPLDQANKDISLSFFSAHSIESSFDVASLSQTPAGTRLLGEDVWGNGVYTPFSLGF